MKLQIKDLAGKVGELLQEPFLLRSTAETRSKPVQKNGTVKEAAIVHSAGGIINSQQLASEQTS